MQAAGEGEGVGGGRGRGGEAARAVGGLKRFFDPLIYFVSILICHLADGSLTK